MNQHLFYLLISAVSIMITFFIVYFVAFRVLNIRLQEEPDSKLNNDFSLHKQESENTVIQIFSICSIFNWLQPYKAPIQITVSGSGFFINEEGYFVTNSHVVDQAKSIWVQIPAFGRRNIDAQVVSVCPDSDVALLKLTDSSLKEVKEILGKISYLNFGDSDKVFRTDKVLVLGYPLGQHNLKATTGIISGKEHIEEQLFIQIDAAINPGSSGGPVINDKGEVIGITTVMIPAAQNVGYIIPINQLKIILKDMFTSSFLRKQILGIDYHNVTIEQVKYLHNPLPGGLYVNKVYKDSIAQKAGLLAGDMIYEINGCKVDIYGDVKTPWDLENIPFIDFISRLEKGAELNLQIYREGKKINLNFKFEGDLLYPIRIFYTQYEKIDYEIIGGVVVMQLTENHIRILFPMIPELIKYEQPENQTEPLLLITYIFPESEIYRLKTLYCGDIIESINEIKVKTLRDFRNALKESLKTGYFVIKTSGAFVVLDIMHVLRDEYRFSQDYKYPLSQTIEELLTLFKNNSDKKI